MQVVYWRFHCFMLASGFYCVVQTLNSGQVPLQTKLFDASKTPWTKRSLWRKTISKFNRSACGAMIFLVSVYFLECKRSGFKWNLFCRLPLFAVVKTNLLLLYCSCWNTSTQFSASCLGSLFTCCIPCLLHESEAN